MISTLRNTDYCVTGKYAQNLNRHLKQPHSNTTHYVKFENNACLPCINKNSMHNSCEIQQNKLILVYYD